MNYKNKWVVAVVWLLWNLSGVLHSETTDYSFQKLWALTRAHSPELAAAQHELQAAKLGESRAALHWVPRLYATAQGYSTNDPARSFMSLLDQRQITGTDFSPAALNEPESRVYETGTLGIDLPLFEGGAQVSLAAAAQEGRKAQEWQLQAEQKGQYVALASRYAELLALQKEQEDLDQLSQKVQTTIEQYRIGSRSNPVGYSGLLGLKNLANRLQGLLNQNHSQQTSLRDQIRSNVPEIPSDWVPPLESVSNFLDEHLPVSEEEAKALPPAAQAAQANADRLEKMKGVQTAQWLPRIGLFAEGDLTNGDQATATSYTSGAYLQWNLFSASNIDAEAQADQEAQAARSQAQALIQQAGVSRREAQQQRQALQENLKLMDNSAQMLEEQTRTAIDLFKNGSINALQLVEVLSRRADLLTNILDAEMGLVNAAATYALNSASTPGAFHEKP